MSRLGVVLPAYHPNLDRLVDYVHAIDETLAPREIRIELDDPRPGSLDRLESVSTATATLTVNAVDDRRGKGTAITAGFEALAPTVDVLAFADADGSTPADSLADVLDPVLGGDADLSVGSRRHPDAEIVSHQTLARRRLGDGFAWLARRFLDVSLSDYQCGAKALTTDLWRRVRGHLYEPGFAWDIELVAVASAFEVRVAEVPVVWEDQPNSTVSPVKTTLRLARGLVVSRHRARTLRQDRLHTFIDRSRSTEPSLVERLGLETVEE